MNSNTPAPWNLQAPILDAVLELSTFPGNDGPNSPVTVGLLNAATIGAQYQQFLLNVIAAMAMIGGVNFVGTETGADNAIASAKNSGPPIAAGVQVTILLAHGLGVGPNTFAYNGGVAAPIKSHIDPNNDIGIGYAPGGIIPLMYDGTRWQDLSQ